METINKTKQSKTKTRILNYFDKCSKHLFIENKRFHKIMSFTYKGETYYVEINSDGKTVNSKINKVSYFTPGDLRYYKDTLFPDYNSEKRYAIKNFDVMKDKMNTVLELVKKDFKGEVGYGKNVKIQKEIEKILIGIEPKL